MTITLIYQGLLCICAQPDMMLENSQCLSKPTDYEVVNAYIVVQGV